MQRLLARKGGRPWHDRGFGGGVFSARNCTFCVGVVFSLVAKTNAAPLDGGVGRWGGWRRGLGSGRGDGGGSGGCCWSYGWSGSLRRGSGGRCVWSWGWYFGNVLHVFPRCRVFVSDQRRCGFGHGGDRIWGWYFGKVLRVLRRRRVFVNGGKGRRILQGMRLI